MDLVVDLWEWEVPHEAEIEVVVTTASAAEAGETLVEVTAAEVTITSAVVVVWTEVAEEDPGRDGARFDCELVWKLTLKCIHLNLID